MNDTQSIYVLYSSLWDERVPQFASTIKQALEVQFDLPVHTQNWNYCLEVQDILTCFSSKGIIVVMTELLEEQMNYILSRPFERQEDETHQLKWIWARYLIDIYSKDRLIGVYYDGADAIEWIPSNQVIYDQSIQQLFSQVQRILDY